MEGAYMADQWQRWACGCLGLIKAAGRGPRMSRGHGERHYGITPLRPEGGVAS